MNTNVLLPQWLDFLIYDELGAKYQRSNADMTVIDWDKSDVLNYLGTYFPRSYAESYCIFSEFFRLHPEHFSDRAELSVFDFGCGTGGEIVGLLTAISEKSPCIKSVSVHAMDGNHHALRLLERVISVFNEKTIGNVCLRIIPLTIDDFYDLEVLNRELECRFDIFMTFKAICEFVTKDRFERQNAYTHIVNSFLPRLHDGGIMVIVDVSTYNNVSQEWLPKMMDAGLAHTDSQVLLRNEGYNQVFTVSHQKKCNDVSKVAWRIIHKQ